MTQEESTAVDGQQEAADWFMRTQQATTWADLRDLGEWLRDANNRERFRRIEMLWDRAPTVNDLRRYRPDWLKP